MEKITLTPQEKAEDLLIKYSEILPSRNYIVDIRDIDTSKKCAIIAVDEILYVIQNLYFMGTVEYWQEVKKEIEKL
jgi:hypothetical protein